MSLPIIYTEQCDTAVQGQIVGLRGANFDAGLSAKLEVRSGEDREKVHFPQIVHLALDHVALKIPEGLKSGIYAISCSNDGSTWCRPYLLNAPRLLFVDEREVAPGERIRVIGKHLAGAEAAPVLTLVNERTASGTEAAIIQLNIAAFDSYKAIRACRRFCGGS